MSPQDFNHLWKWFWTIAGWALGLMFLLGAVLAAVIIFILRV